MDQARHGTLHHVEIWVPNLDRAVDSWGWLLGVLGYEPFQDWPGGRSWRCGPTYIVIEQSPARTATRHDRCRPGLNHLAFHVESRERTDELSVDAGQYGWRMLFADQYPYAGGTGHYAAYLENIDGFEVELVAPSMAEAAEAQVPAAAPAVVPPPAMETPAPPTVSPASASPASASPASAGPASAGPATASPATAPLAPQVPAPAPLAPPVRPSVFLRSAVSEGQGPADVVRVGAEGEPASGPPAAGAPPVPGAPAGGSA